MVWKIYTLTFEKNVDNLFGKISEEKFIEILKPHLKKDFDIKISD